MHRFAKIFCLGLFIFFGVCSQVVSENEKQKGRLNVSEMSFRELADWIDTDASSYFYYLEQKLIWQRTHEGSFDDEIEQYREKMQAGEVGSAVGVERLKMLIGYEEYAWLEDLKGILWQVHEFPVAKLKQMGGLDEIDELIRVLNDLEIQARSKVDWAYQVGKMDADKIQDAYTFVLGSRSIAELIKKTLRVEQGVDVDTMSARFIAWVKGYDEYRAGMRRAHQRMPGSTISFGPYDELDLKLDLLGEMSGEAMLERGVDEQLTAILRFVLDRKEEMPWQADFMCYDMEGLLLKMGGERFKDLLAKRIYDAEYPIATRMTMLMGGSLGAEEMKSCLEKKETDEGYQNQLLKAADEYRELRDLIWGHDDASIDVDLRCEWDQVKQQLVVEVEAKNVGDEVLSIEERLDRTVMRLFMVSEDGGQLLEGSLGLIIGDYGVKRLEVGDSVRERIVFQLSELAYRVAGENRVVKLLGGNDRQSMSGVVMRRPGRFGVYALLAHEYCGVGVDMPNRLGEAYRGDAWVGWAVSEPVMVEVDWE
ncbi:hypothetical protein KS4_05720 [Poriferisphaera corsica]|uniref:Uncharacterized protein n=1 Tax=Poriferisphaera corsica TaxID=2528020 RepID=A0A517YQP6_9BACT|nr:hypothetical protein [Poriferisphaera corsica]QDU32540.1 hypothetical protein KS4_05720 [Poriferisphaera corsica]